MGVAVISNAILSLLLPVLFSLQFSRNSQSTQKAREALAFQPGKYSGQKLNNQGLSWTQTYNTIVAGIIVFI